MPKKALIHISWRQYFFPKPTWHLPIYIFKDYTGIVNQLIPCLGRSGCGGRPQCWLPELFPSRPNFHLYSYFLISPLRPKQRLHKWNQSGWENNRTYCILQICTFMPLSCIRLTALPLCVSPLMTDNVTSPHLEEKGTFTKWTTFSGFLFSFPRTFPTREVQLCCRSWSRRHRKGNAVVWSRGRRGRKEVWGVSLQDGSRPTSHHKGTAGLKQNCAVSASHLHVGTQQNRSTDRMKITSVNNKATLRSCIQTRTVAVNQNPFASDHFPGRSP